MNPEPAWIRCDVANPVDGLLRSARSWPQHVALEITHQRWTYADLCQRVLQLRSQILSSCASAPTNPRVGVLASRSIGACAGSMAVLASGATLVALNPAYPLQRNLAIVRQAGMEVLVVGHEAQAAAAALVQACAAAGVALRIIKVETQADATANPAPMPLPAPAAQDLAYIVFTSGSTGQPKGVAIDHGNLASYLANFNRLEPMQHSDRVASTYELTFDVALHDMLCAWTAGATLVVLPERGMLAPARFILDQHITVWFSVASFAMILHRQGLLRPGLFSALRLSLLCGEALPVSTAVAWAAAAPNSRLYNVYGPTETTMELAFYRWHVTRSPLQCRRGVVPIGMPFADHAHLLLDCQGQEVVGPGEGELYLQGPQIGPGYWGDAQRTAQSFVHLPARSGIWYKTGDRVERDTLGDYHFVSRVDFMVKLRGHRVELGEVESALRQASGTDLVAVVPRPAADGLAMGLVAFVHAPAGQAAAPIRDHLARLLPKAWLPDEVRMLDEWPLNSNRKLDRGALAALAAVENLAVASALTA